ncbi:MAG: hydroxyethylthiazole kinase [Treponema sp.]|jgi:hydroxyethylthiazole kinase|nr:hydroxyethylthiazole kinase [Treponema sp.]
MITEKAAAIIERVREENPLVHCITNYITINDCANILLSAGASPAMCDALDEAYDFARISSALYINFGTYIKEQEAAAAAAALGAKSAGRPIVIDPVGCAAIPRRIGILDRLHELAGVSIIKGNMGEIMALAGKKAEVKGVDSDGAVPGIEEAAAETAKKYGCVVAATGKIDVISDGRRTARVSNGVPMLTKITGSGCMTGALCAAAAAAARDRDEMFAAAAAAVSVMGIAGERAAAKANLPGSFRTALIDAVYGITGKILRDMGRIECEEM